ncbi:MAG: archaellin/type IV pilin N-terminal domain-containing protein [Nitrososphaeria archaeon]
MARIFSSRRRRRAIGELLSVIIVIAITIVAGLVLYSFVMGKISLFGNSPGLQIENAQITDGVVIVSVKNTGSYSFSNVSIQIYLNGQALGGPQQIPLPPGGLGPGQTASFTGSFSAITGEAEQIGSLYTIVVTGRFGGSQTFTVSAGVVAS